MYKVLIADDHPLFRDAITHILAEKFPDCATQETEDIATTLAVAKQHPDLDLIMLDLNMPGMSGLNGLLDLISECPTTPVVVVSAENNKQIILQTMAYGAVGFISKSSSKDEISDAISMVLEGNVYLPADILRAQSTSTSKHDSPILPEMLSSLTRRQLMVLKCMTKGEANKQIAYNLNVSETTVKSHVSSILKKLGVTNRVQAVLGCSGIDFNQYLKR
ncbi:response regulator transcription factor [Vibrio panuliri]|uniref:DNA-binding response regulator n=1 Tax=Vibrio panuliri TaxID=1381081 RepID=A0ABX3F9T0_9VIBR|nr:response regulator transcription factor [Vibrio panuliri]KAB1457532.1 response regulator transcription factor [Vibrio panuliri]OLQ87690.1 DNA-binding response regulator [Vibrio panuliri]